MRARGELRRRYRGVYLLGPVEPPLARPMAAVLACGPHAYVSHRTAAYLWQLLPYPAQERPLTLTVSGRNPGPKRDLELHRVTGLAPDETTILDGIPITTPPRTILDLAATERARELEQAVAEARARRRVGPGALRALIHRHPRHRGSRPLAALLELDRDPARVRSQAEAELLTLIRRAKLPDPEVNVQLHGYEVDFLWRDEGLVVEVDGPAYHSSGSAVRRDREKEAVLARHRLDLVRLLPAQVESEPEVVITRIAGALAIRGRRGRG